MISKDLLDILACPQCKKPIKSGKDENSLVCLNCKLVYEIRDGIPRMIVEKAKPLE